MILTLNCKSDLTTKINKIQPGREYKIATVFKNSKINTINFPLEPLGTLCLAEILYDILLGPLFFRIIKKNL